MVDVSDKESTDKIVIPSFITKVIDEDRNIVGPFKECKFEEVYIDNKKGNIKDLSFLFYQSKSRRIKLEVNGGASIESTLAMFGECSNLEEVELLGLERSNIKSTTSMFEGCLRISKIDLRNVNIDNVKNARYMFYRCKRLNKIIFGRVRNRVLNDASYLFLDCSRLESIEIEEAKIIGIENMRGMFKECSSLAKIDINMLDTSNVKDISYLCFGCTSLEHIIIGDYKYKGYVNAVGVFDNCAKLNKDNLGEIEREINNKYIGKL